MIVAFYSFTCESGKDTATRFAVEWCEAHGLSARRVSFADEMKVVCADALGLTGTRKVKIEVIDWLKLHGEVRAMETIEDGPAVAAPRQLTLTGGRDFIIGLAESIRRLDKTFWIRHAFTGEPVDVYVVSDLRFLPEGKHVKGLGGSVVEIVRPYTKRRNEDRLSRDMVDWVIYNAGTLDELRDRVDAAMDRLVQVQSQA